MRCDARLVRCLANGKVTQHLLFTIHLSTLGMAAAGEREVDPVQIRALFQSSKFGRLRHAQEPLFHMHAACRSL